MSENSPLPEQNEEECSEREEREENIKRRQKKEKKKKKVRHGKKEKSKKPKKAETRGSILANLIFPLGRINAEIKRSFENSSHYVRKMSSVYLTAYLEYLMSKIMFEAFRLAVKDNRSRVSIEYILMAIHNNAVFSKLFEVPSLESSEEYQKRLIKINSKKQQKNKGKTEEDSQTTTTPTTTKKKRKNIILEDQEEDPILPVSKKKRPKKSKATDLITNKISEENNEVNTSAGEKESEI